MRMKCDYGLCVREKNNHHGGGRGGGEAQLCMTVTKLIV